jgi:hypothetical protein
MLSFVVLVQVLDWLANHGEVFLRKNIGIGRNLQKARVYQKSHEHFENVAQVSAHVTFGGFWKWPAVFGDFKTKSIISGCVIEFVTALHNVLAALEDSIL